MLDLLASNGAIAMVLAFSVGYGFGSNTLLDRWERFLTSSWWNMYLSLVLSYVTIRLYQLFIDPILERLASGGRSGEVPVPSLTSPNAQRRSSQMTARDLDVFSRLKRIDEDGEEEEDAMVRGGPLSPGAKGGSKRTQPIDMSGRFKLIQNDNFDNFLVAQGLSWYLAKAADKARPIHSITHLGKFITIKIEGIIESSSTYEINGEPVEGLIRGRLFADQVTYLTYQDLGETPPDGNDDDESDENNMATSNKSTTASSKNTPYMVSRSQSHGSESNKMGDRIKKTLADASIGFEEFKDNLKKGMDEAFNTPVKKDVSSSTRYTKAKIAPQTLKNSSTGGNAETKANNSAPADLSSSDNTDEPSMPMVMPETVQVLPRDIAASNTTARQTKNICGIKTTKRAINDGYTVTVRRKLTRDKSRIIMFSSVEFDDPKKELVRAKQIFERE